MSEAFRESPPHPCGSLKESNCAANSFAPTFSRRSPNPGGLTHLSGEAEVMLRCRLIPDRDPARGGVNPASPWPPTSCPRVPSEPPLNPRPAPSAPNPHMALPLFRKGISSYPGQRRLVAVMQRVDRRHRRHTATTSPSPVGLTLGLIRVLASCTASRSRLRDDSARHPCGPGGRACVSSSSPGVCV